MRSAIAAMDLPSPASANEYDISDMEFVAQRAGKAAAADDESRPKKFSSEETLFLAKNFIDVFEDPIFGNVQQSKKCSGSGSPRSLTLVDQEGRSSQAT